MENTITLCELLRLKKEADEQIQKIISDFQDKTGQPLEVYNEWTYAETRAGEIRGMRYYSKIEIK